MPEDSAGEYTDKDEEPYTDEERRADEQLERITDLANKIYNTCVDAALDREEAIAAVHFALSRLHTPPLDR